MTEIKLSQVVFLGQFHQNIERFQKPYKEALKLLEEDKAVWCYWDGSEIVISDKPIK